MKDWNTYVCLDLETTGLEPKTDDIIEFAAIKVKNGEIVDRYESLIYTPLELSEIVTYLTGIRSADLTNAPEWSAIQNKGIDFIGDFPIVGHNIAFDMDFLKQKGMKGSNPQWDSYILSTLLYPELPSHSLETFSKYFSLTHEDSHRAMSDVMACHALWQILIKTFPELLPAQHQRIRELSAKTTWGMMDFFLEERASHRVNYQLLKGDLPDVENIPVQVHNEESLLIHCRGNDPLAFVTVREERQLFVAGFHHTRDRLKQAMPSVLHFSGPSETYSQEKLEALFQKESLTEAETHLLLRLTLYPDKWNSGELALSHGERFESWKKIQADENTMLSEPESPAAKHYREAVEAHDVVTSHQFLFKHPEIARHFNRIVILEPELFTENASWANTLSSTLEQWEAVAPDEQWTSFGKTLFKLLHDLLRQVIPSSPYNEKVLLTQDIRDAAAFRGLIKSLHDESLNCKSTTPKGEFLGFYKTFFLRNDPETIRWFSFHPQWGITLYTTPLNISELISQKIIGSKPTTIISATLDNFSFGKGLPVTTIASQKSIQLRLPELADIKGTRKEGEHAPLVRYLKQILPTLKGKTGVIFGSKAKLKQYFFEIVDPRLESTTAYFGEDVGNGVGKLLDRYRTTEKANKVIFLTYRNLRVYRPDVMDFDTIILQCLPFDPPGDPITQARSEAAGIKSWDITLLKALRNTLEITNNFTLEKGRGNNLYMIDPKVQEKDYGTRFINLFETS